MTDPRLQWVSTITVGLLAVMLIGGSVAGWLLGRDLPTWLAQADGMIILAAFGHSAFFAVARAAEPTADMASDMANKHHELAMAAVVAATTPTGAPPSVPEAA